MTILDNPARLRELDSMDSIKTTENYHLQFTEGLDLATKFTLPAAYRRPWQQILILGTGGGSSIAGALLNSLFIDHLKQPVIVNQGYNAPAFVNEDTLVIALSHSGNTEEILSALGQACHLGGKPLAITAGGALADICQAESFPHLIVPRDIGHPRRNLGYIVVPLVLALAQLGLVPDISADIRETITAMESWGQQWGANTPLADNQAKQLAQAIKGHIPLVYGSSDHLGAVAWRWKNQFGENSKLMAFYNLIPHLHHDEAVGWDMEPQLLNKLMLIMLRDNILDSPKVQKRKQISAEMLSTRMGGVREVWAQGESRFARLFSLIHLGDFVSLYAALIREIDPTPVEIINLFKEKMGQ
ncbi:MAG: bifunctional phosphoglucose/phosphomannose isomerase [Firmicutes bacterium]|nr:bifunctional phosphoglucose/phosphomannose isomerase [Bacillota bacterium]